MAGPLSDEQTTVLRARARLGAQIKQAAYQVLALCRCQETQLQVKAYEFLIEQSLPEGLDLKWPGDLVTGQRVLRTLRHDHQELQREAQRLQAERRRKVHTRGR